MSIITVRRRREQHLIVTIQKSAAGEHFDVLITATAAVGGDRCSHADIAGAVPASAMALLLSLLYVPGRF